MPVMMVSGCTVLLFALVVVRLDTRSAPFGWRFVARVEAACASPRMPLSPSLRHQCAVAAWASEEDDGWRGEPGPRRRG